MQLTVIEYAGKPVKSRTSVEFRPPGGTIGRNADNQLVLPDETRQISRLQALLQIDGTHCVLKNLSSVSVVQVNDVPLACAQEQPVQGGDAIRIGPYVLRVDAPAAASRDAGQVPRETAAPLQRQEQEQAQRAKSNGVLEIPTDPLALFALIDSAGQTGARAGQRATASTPHTQRDVATARAPAIAERIPAQGASLAEYSRPEQHSGASERADATRSEPGSPSLSSKAGQATASAVASADNNERQSADALLAAFLKGAGLDKATCDWSTEQLRTAGQLLALFANGTVELLSSRSILKREVKADMTVLLDRENNPLKLLPDGSAALRQMFGLPFPGFMPPASAVEDAFHDLHAHHIAMVAGMRAALIDLLTRFSPEQIERRAGTESRLERMLPLARAARLWNRYTSLHRDTVLAVEDDFSAVFGKAFLSAYDEEVKNYHARRQPRGARET